MKERLLDMWPGNVHLNKLVVGGDLVKGSEAGGHPSGPSSAKARVPSMSHDHLNIYFKKECES